MTTTCPICDAKVPENVHAMECSKCKKWIHKKCTGLSNEDYSKTCEKVKKKGHKWLCKFCVSATPNATKTLKTDYSIADVMQKLEKMDNGNQELLKMFDVQRKINQDLRAEIDQLKEQVRNLTLHRGEEANPLQTLREIDDREARKCNLMIFGCDETASDEDKHLDTELAQEIIGAVCPEIDTSKIRALRVGKGDQNRKRPIRVKLGSSRDARNIFFKAKEIVKQEKYKHIAVGFDKTKREIEEYRALRGEMQTRVENGETNLRIKYFRNMPKIIKISSTTTSKNQH